MDDLISREEAIDAIVERTHMDWESMKILYPMLEVIDNLPIAYPKKGKWIPCSERLPETYGEYIVTRKTENGIKTKTSLYYENGIWWPPEEVIAWMDLPEPYKEPNNDD